MAKPVKLCHSQTNLLDMLLSDVNLTHCCYGKQQKYKKSPKKFVTKNESSKYYLLKLEKNKK